VPTLPDLQQPFEIETNASNYAIGAVLTQHGHPVAYHSETLSDIIQKYRTYDKEKMLKKGYHGVISQFNAIQVTEQASQVVPPSLQLISTSTQRYLRYPLPYIPSEVSMIIASLSFLEVNHPMYAPTGIHLLKKMKYKR